MIRRTFVRAMSCMSLLLMVAFNSTLTSVQAVESKEALPRDNGETAVNSKDPTPRNEVETTSVVGNSNDGENSTAENSPSKRDPVKDFLGQGIIQILSKPDSVESFRVGHELAEPNVPDKNQLGGFPILKEGPKLTKEQIKKFQTLALDKGSYLFRVDKRCMFRPDTGLHFVKGDKEVEVLLSVSCAIWLFIHEGEQKMEDFDPVYKQLQQFRNSLFAAAQTGN